jgi:hypothetical protein
MKPKGMPKRSPSDTKKKRTPRCTKAEKTKRVFEIFRLHLGGAEWLDLWQFVSEQKWGITERQLRRYLVAATDLYATFFDAKAAHLLNRHLMQRRQLYAHALGVGDYGTALRVLVDEAKLESLYQPERDIEARLQALEQHASNKPKEASP